jgi:hypothetical protein
MIFLLDSNDNNLKKQTIMKTDQIKTTKSSETPSKLKLIGRAVKLTKSGLNGDADDGNPDDNSNYSWKEQ